MCNNIVLDTSKKITLADIKKLDLPKVKSEITNIIVLKFVCHNGECTNLIKNKNYYYCSKKCADEASIKLQKKCLIDECENRVKSKRSLYCSKKCYTVSRTKEKHVCEREGCGNMVKPWNRFCSKECYKTAIKNKNRLDSCLNCGNSLERLRDNNKYCSKKCYLEYVKKNAKNYYVCQNEGCHNALTKSQRQSLNKFCSSNCYMESKQKNAKTIFIQKRNNKIRRYIKDEQGKFILFSQHVWEQKYGAVPKFHYIDFKDENTLNDDIENLCLRKYGYNLNKQTKNNNETTREN